MAATGTVEKEKIASFVDSGYNRKNQERIAREEAELEELIRLQRGDAPKEEDEPKAQEPAKEPEDENLSGEEKSFKKRYGDLRRHMSEKEKEWQKKFEQLEARLNNTSAIVPPSSDEDLEAWIAKYPDVASVVKALADKAANERFKGADEELEELKSMRIEAKKEKAEAQIRKKHSDFDEIKVADEFHDWAEEQPKWIQDAIYENLEDPLALIRAIDLYKADKGLTTSAKKQKEKEAAGSIINKSSRVVVESDEGSFTFSESQVNKMSDKEYEKNEDKIMEAMRSGKFLYDMSGGAR